MKDRANCITSMGWMDVMINVTLAADFAGHICEIQVVHSKMLLARAGLGGHAPYAKVRAAAEILEVHGSPLRRFVAAGRRISHSAAVIAQVQPERSGDM